MGYKAAQNNCSSAFRRSPLRFRLYASNIFFKPYCRALCFGNFFGSKTNRCFNNDFSSRQRHCHKLVGNGCGGFCRLSYINGICACRFLEGKENVNACCLRNYDRLYMLCRYGFGCYFCRRLKHCKSSQLVTRKLFGHKLGKHTGYGHNCFCCFYGGFSSVKTNKCISYGRGLCTKYGRKRKNAQSSSYTYFKPSFSLRNGFCRADFVCWHSSSSYC